MVRTSIGVTHYSLVYGCEVVIALDIQIPSVHTTLVMNMVTKENHRRPLE